MVLHRPGAFSWARPDARDCAPAGSQKPTGNMTKPGSGGVHPTLAYRNQTAAAAAPAKAEPSWGRVLATTIKLATPRRLRSARFGSPATARQRGRNWFRWGRRHLRQPAARRWRLTGLLLLALAVVASGAVQFTGVIAGTASPAANAGLRNPPAGSADPPAGPAMSALAAGAAMRSDFAAPSPLGLLTPVLETDLQPAPARDRESLVRAAGERTNQMRGE
jgi:hypothetical protein